MSARIANISMMHHAGLAGIEAGLHSSLGIENREYHDSLIYSAMIQAGVQRFRIVGGMTKQVRESKFLRCRCEEYSFEDYKQLMDSVQETLNQHAVRHLKKDSEHTDLFTLTWFLTELIFSLQTKSAMVSVLPMPNIAEYAGKLTPDMFAAVRGLFQKIDPLPLDLPIPQLSVLSGDVKVFHDVISSDLFASYAESHQMLESSREEKQSTIRLILNKAKILHNSFSNVLDLKRISLSLIPLTTSLIDSVCGKFPGSLADVFGNALTEALNNKRRITIYNYGDTHMRLLLDYYRAVNVIQGGKPQPDA